MLHVEKQQLLATNAQDIARFRATELQYYVEHIGSIQTIATLLAGFAFTAFLQLETVELDVQTVFMQRFRGEYKFVNGTYIERDFAPMDPMAIASFVVYAVEVFSVCFTFVEMISVLLETLIARLLGSRLALRGQDGSIIVATKGLAKSLLKATTRFIVGLQWFLFSVVCHAIRGMHPFISIVVLVTIFTYWRSQFALAKRLVTEFYLRKAVHTSWNELTGKVVTEADRQAAQAADDAEELRRKLALENRNGSSVAGRLYTRLQNAFLLQMLLRQVDDVDGEEGIGKEPYEAPGQATEHLIMRLQAEGMGAPQITRQRTRNKFLPAIRRGASRGNLSPEGSSPASENPMIGDWKRMFGGLFGFGTDPYSRSASRRPSACASEAASPSDRSVRFVDDSGRDERPAAAAAASSSSSSGAGRSSACAPGKAPGGRAPGWGPSMDSPV